MNTKCICCKDCDLTLNAFNRLQAIKNKLYPNFVREVKNNDSLVTHSLIKSDSSKPKTEIKFLKSMNLQTFNNFEIKFIDNNYDKIEFQLILKLFANLFIFLISLYINYNDLFFFKVLEILMRCMLISMR